MATCVVLGGGISGLSAAYYLLRNGTHLVKRVILLEASSRVGGWVHSTKFDDGCVYEFGPRSIRPVGATGQNTLELIDELGLTNDVISVSSTAPAAKNRFIYAHGQLNMLPNSLSSLLRRVPPFKSPLGWHIAKEPFRAKGTLDDESVYDFVSRRIAPEVAQYAVDPLCRGVFAGDAKQLSVSACLPPVWNYEQSHGSIVRGALFSPKEKKLPTVYESVKKCREEKWATYSLRHGLQSLSDKLLQRLQEDGVDVQMSAPCTSLKFDKDKVQVQWQGGQTEADYVISSIQSSNLSMLLADAHPDLSHDLASIPSVDVVVVNLEYDGDVLPVKGFGHLIPSCEPEKVLGVVYESCVFPQHNRVGGKSTRLTCMMGGAWFEEHFGKLGEKDERYFEDLAIESVSQQLGVVTRPYRSKVTMSKACIPQYLVGHTALVDRILGYINDHELPLSIVGASYKGPSVNDCIYKTRLEIDDVLSSDRFR